MGGGGPFTFPFGVVERRESVSEQHGALFALERTEPAGEKAKPQRDRGAVDEVLL